MHPIARHLALLSVALLGSTAALAQSFPTKPIRAVVPFAAGSATDQIGRAFAEKMSATLGQPVIVDNKPGASGMLGAAEVAKAAPDGYTILVGTNSTNAALKSLMKQLPYDQDKAFAPVAYMGSVPLIMAVHPDVPAKNFREFVDYVKKHPGELNYGSAGNASAGHLAMEYLKLVTGMYITHIPYRGTGPQLTDLLAGRTQA